MDPILDPHGNQVIPPDTKQPEEEGLWNPELKDKHRVWETPQEGELKDKSRKEVLEERRAGQNLPGL